ncbi:hypothetical protein BH11ACT7_BH11ACT7_11740 [soil metagenome]
MVGATAGVVAIAAAVAIAVPTLQGGSAPAANTLTTARSLTVSVPQAAVPLTERQLSALLEQPADLGALGAPGRLSACLGGLGYPSSTPVLGATPVDINGRPAVVLLIAAEDPRLIDALAVGPYCSGADTGLVADTVVPRP